VEGLFDFALLRKGLVGLKLCNSKATDSQLFALYMDEPKARTISPCHLFSEGWYRRRYPDVASAIARGIVESGFFHYLKAGLREGRWPSLEMEKLARASASSPPVADARLHDVRLDSHAYRFLAVFSWISPVEYYNFYGRHMSCSVEAIAPRMEDQTDLRQMQVAEFDAKYYRKRYMASNSKIDPVEHYFTVGVKRQYSPNAWFQEDWYQAFYWDVQDAVKSGALPSGFCHYLVAGRAEGRMPAFELSRALEVKMPGVTDPVLLKRTEFLRDRVHRTRDIKVPLAVEKSVVTVWFVLPVLNADISFGGYQACYALICALARQRFRIGIICMEEQRPNREYFVWRTADDTLRNILQDCELIGRDHLPQLEIGSQDLFVSYSVWDLAVAAAFAAQTRNKIPYLLMQEYEPVFYDSSAMRAVCAAQYKIPHIPIINSRFLELYARDNQIGVFKSAKSKSPRYVCFEHKINALPAQSAAAMSQRPKRVLAAYARPEAHASRNLFEMVVITLQRMCNEGLFGSEWSFVGLGALSELPDIYLAKGHSLKLVKKMEEKAYVEFMGTLDIGISMMDAPHPSVIPFEFATTGALVITNTYENRSIEDFEDLSENFIPCEPSLEGMEDALREAIERVGDYESRAANVYVPTATSWAKVFNADFIRGAFGRPMRPLEVVARTPALKPVRRDARVSARTVKKLNVH